MCGRSLGLSSSPGFQAWNIDAQDSVRNHQVTTPKTHHSSNPSPSLPFLANGPPSPSRPPNPGLTAAHEHMDEDENEVNASRTRLPAIPDTTPPFSAFLTFLAGVLNNPGNRSTSGSVTINSDKLELIQQMIKVEDSRLQKMEARFDSLNGRIAQLKTLRLSPAAPPTHPSKPLYARAIVTSNEPRRPQMNPPARSTLQTFKPGKAIIHSNPDHDDVRKLDCGFLVQRANEVLAKLDAQVQGEKITIKAAQVLKSGDVCFFSKITRSKSGLWKTSINGLKMYMNISKLPLVPSWLLPTESPKNSTQRLKPVLTRSPWQITSVLNISFE
ncbi:hypothetical protein Pst134EA_021225 [Puccinia striiformis f. sp. tritici]|uniref:hypothetical protein n=1 Tax=Puccinia striiformis f. sp. tritici TaxID=168172 RepID=UPI00200816A3|nr:hypothetical protein Pst134EA_021225 [Puccinia striiformis f. sp. tritici]KAH9457342.1 hypothetical protein Pst134EA_021225 [Puccinia striiformis f. sp. tritici]